MNPVVFFFVLDEYCAIIGQLGLKILSCKLQVNYVISYFFIYI